MNLNFYSCLKSKWMLLTWLNLRPFLHLDPFVLKFNSAIAEDHPDDLSPSTTVKVQQLNFWSHFDCLNYFKYRGILLCERIDRDYRRFGEGIVYNPPPPRCTHSPVKREVSPAWVAQLAIYHRVTIWFGRPTGFMFMT